MEYKRKYSENKSIFFYFPFLGSSGHTHQKRPKDSHHRICGQYRRPLGTLYGIQSGFGFRNCLPLYDDCVLDKRSFLPPANFAGMARRVVEFSSEGYKIRKIFASESTCPKKINWILSFGLMVSCQKQGIVLVIKWFENWFYQEMSIGILQWKKRFRWFLT